MLYKLLNKVISIGYDDQTPSFEKKRTKILNFSCILLGFTTVFFFILNFFEGILNLPITLNYTFQLCLLVTIIYFNSIKKWYTARMLFTLFCFAILIIQNNLLFKGYYGEYLYIVMPILSMFFFNKKVIYFSVLLVSIALFYIPNLILNIYPDAYFGYTNTNFVFIGVFSVVYFFKNENTKNELQLKEYNKKLALAFKQLESSKQNELAISNLKALQSQMNPHFIFNSLNAIQDLVLQEDTEKSYDYIVLFSQLARNTLNYSDKTFIAIEKELEFLEVYLTLEKLRFGEELIYSVNYTYDNEIKVPPLMIQPFIENSLLHGLLHKKGEKKLTINFNLGKELVCEIIDNGIGRKKAKEIKQKKQIVHKSFSTGAIKKRMQILRKQYNMDVNFNYEDLLEGNIAIGTKVTLCIPFERF